MCDDNGRKAVEMCMSATTAFTCSIALRTHLLNESIEDDDAHGRQRPLDAVLVAVPVIILRAVAVVLYLQGGKEQTNSLVDLKLIEK